MSISDYRLKTLLISALLNDNVTFAKKLMDDLVSKENMESNYELDEIVVSKQHTKCDYNLINKDIALILQDLSDPESLTSYGISISHFDNYETVYEKIHVNLYLKYAFDDSYNHKYAKELLDNYNGNLIKLKQSILCLFDKR